MFQCNNKLSSIDFSQTTILDGKTGKALLKPYIRSSIGTQVSPLTVSMKGKGNDLFLYWLADCKGHEGQSDRFQFAEGKLVMIVGFSLLYRTPLCKRNIYKLWNKRRKLWYYLIIVLCVRC